MARRIRKKGPKKVETLVHDEATRKNIPTAEMSSMAQRSEETEPFEPEAYIAKAEIDKEAWEPVYRGVPRQFAKPTTGRFAVKVINHFGDEVIKNLG